MHFRWTMKELVEATDNEIIRSLIVERQSELTNVYTLFYRRLGQIYSKVDKQVMEEQVKKGKEEYESEKATKR